MIIPFGIYFGKTIEQVGDTDEGLVYLDGIVDDCDGDVKRELVTYLKKNSVRVDVALEGRRGYGERREDREPIVRPW